MHIAYVVADQGILVFGAKGASVHVREMVKAFASLGHEISLVVRRRGLDVTPLPAEIIKVRTQPVAEPLENAEHSEKVRLRERHAIDSNQFFYAELIDLHARKPIDFIYERYCLFSTAGPRAAKSLELPCAVEINSPLRLEQERYRTLIHAAEAEAVEREVFESDALLFSVSEEVQSYVLSRGGAEERANVLPNTVDCRHFSADCVAIDFANSEQRFVIGFTGSLKPWHGIENLMESFRLLLTHNRRYHLLIVGDGPLREWIEGYAEGAEFSSHLTITGWVNHQTLPGWLAAMDVAVAPYPLIKEFYFSPLKLYEYMAAELPIIASDIGQISNVIIDGENGLLVRPGDATAIAEAVSRLSLNPDTCERLGKAARRQVKLHTWKDNAQQVLDLAFSDRSVVEARA